MGSVKTGRVGQGTRVRFSERDEGYLSNQANQNNNHGRSGSITVLTRVLIYTDVCKQRKKLKAKQAKTEKFNSLVESNRKCFNLNSTFE